MSDLPFLNFVLSTFTHCLLETACTSNALFMLNAVFTAGFINGTFFNVAIKQ